MMDFIITKTIRETDVSALYEAQAAGTDNISSELKYLVKEYHSSFGEELLENELKISQKIENSNLKSIVIPVLWREKDKIILQYRQNGLFLNDMIFRLEKKYGEKNIPLYIQLEIAASILKALALLHHFPGNDNNNGFLHLDLNPGNIFFESVDEDSEKWGSVKFIDFGSSVELSEKDDVLSHRNWICITNGFSAPEVEENDWPHISVTSDLYSVGSCMMRMYYGKNFQKYRPAQKNTEVSDTTDFTKLLFNEIIENCSVEPSYYRYNSADAMLSDIEDLEACIQYINEGKYYSLFCKCFGQNLSVDSVLQVINEPVSKGFSDSVRSLETALIQDNIAYSRCRYVFEGLYRLLLKREDLADDRIKSILLKSGISCYNYTGETMSAIKLFKHLNQIGTQMSISDYVTARLRNVSSLRDCYKYEEARKNLSNLIAALEKFTQLTLSHENIHLTELGRAYSSYATSLALCDNSEAIDYYRKALTQFTGDTGNSSITYSLILHYAMQKNDRALYEEYVSRYLGETKELISRLKTSQHSPFMLFICVNNSDVLVISDVNSFTTYFSELTIKTSE